MTSTHRLPTLLRVTALVLIAIAAHAPEANADDAPICTDRPTKANATCTVPAGRWQVETDIGNTVRDTQPGTRTETVYETNPTLKYGLTDTVDLQLNVSPRIRIRSTDRTTGAHHTTHGVGDVTLRLKTRVFESDTASFALIPFVKAPTAARGIGNDRWEGGLAAPIAVALPAGFSLTLGPELDVLADSDGSGHHAALVNLVNVSHPITHRLTMAVEVWDSVNRDPSGTVRQRSADMALIYLVNPNLQLDAGANIGINRATPDRQVYAGISFRF